MAVGICRRTPLNGAPTASLLNLTVEFAIAGR